MLFGWRKKISSNRSFQKGISLNLKAKMIVSNNSSLSFKKRRKKLPNLKDRPLQTVRSTIWLRFRQKELSWRRLRWVSFRKNNLSQGRFWMSVISFIPSTISLCLKSRSWGCSCRQLSVENRANGPIYTASSITTVGELSLQLKLSLAKDAYASGSKNFNQ